MTDPNTRSIMVDGVEIGRAEAIRGSQSGAWGWTIGDGRDGNSWWGTAPSADEAVAAALKQWTAPNPPTHLTHPKEEA